MQRAGDDQEQRDALFGPIQQQEIPRLLEKLKGRAGFHGLEYEDRAALRGLLTTWYVKSPAAALAWLEGVEKNNERNELVGGIAEDLAKTDLEAAMNLLRMQEPDNLGIGAFSSGLFTAALDKGVDELLELCRVGLYCGPWRGISSQSVPYPEGFDFQRALDGLAEIKGGFGDDAKFMALPSNLIGEWTKRDPQAAWAWLQSGKSVDGSGKIEFFASYATTAKPTEVAALLAADFRPDAPADERYKNIVWVLDDHPSSEMIDSILEAAPGDRAAILQGLLNAHVAFLFEPDNIDPNCKLILERMEPAERLAGLKRIISEGGFIDDKDTVMEGITRLLLPMGHSPEEIRSLFPSDKEE